MMKKMRMFLSILLCFTLLAGIFCPAALPAAAAGETRLYNVYGDHMLFQQKADAVFAGVSAPGTALTVTLTDASGVVRRTASGAAGADGTFSLSFPSPAGGYEAYTVTLTADGAAVCTLSDVVFGELWLSFGQSNMEYTLNITPEGKAMQAAGQTGSRDLRILHVPHPVKDGAICADKLPQTDAQNCFWFTGDQTAVYGISAAAYFFAEQLTARLGMPVGILNTAVGGSGIGAWIPRETIENDASLKQAISDRGAYIPLSDWDAGERQYHVDMTGLYNSKIAPLVHFRPAGAIWYQGETDLILYNDPDYYCRLFDALQDSYTALFSHTGGRLPMVFTQIAAYNYGKGPYAVTKFNEAFTRLALADPESRCEITITDLPLYSSGFNIFDGDIPLYQLVMHGVMPYSTKAVNGSADAERLVMLALASGSNLHFDMLAAETSELKDTDFDVYYYADSDYWIDNAAEYYLFTKDILKKISDSPIISYQREGDRITTKYANGTETVVDLQECSVTADGQTRYLKNYAEEGAVVFK